ncbi:hypothetical protein BJ912DRAFT_288059 [Pholiota molesta]|nr:hypothetical protein BJ912DRAFT_288059 [Pholiota molesta]
MSTIYNVSVLCLRDSSFLPLSFLASLLLPLCSDSFVLVVFWFGLGYCCSLFFCFCCGDDRTCSAVVRFLLEGRWPAGLVVARMGVDAGKSAGMEEGDGVEYALLHANAAGHGRVSRLCVGRRASLRPNMRRVLGRAASLVRRVGAWSGSPRRPLRGFAPGSDRVWGFFEAGLRLQIRPSDHALRI